MNKVNLESRVAGFITRHGLLPRGETVVVAVSGGPDSVCLLHILAGIRQEQDIRLHVAHLNHQLRGAESEAEAEYVSDLARSLGIPATIASQDTPAHRTGRNCSLEEAARELRYAFLADVATDAGATRVATGHTRDDQVETVLMHLLRGTGMGGLGGLAACAPLPSPPSSLRAQGSNLLVVRPLLGTTRNETTRYCQQRALHPCLDSSNLSLSFLRNRLRLELLPLLRQYNPSVDEALLRLADIARDDAAFIAGQASILWEQVAREEDNAICLDRKALAARPTALQRQVLRTALAALAGDVRDIEAVHIESARSLLQKPVGKEVYLPRCLVCRAGYDELVITRLPPRTTGPSSPHTTRGRGESGPVGTEQSQGPPYPYPPLSGEIRLHVPGQTLLPGWTVTANIVSRTTYKGNCEPRPVGVWQSPDAFAAPGGGPLPRGLPRRPDSIGTPRNDSEECRASTPDPFVAYFDLAKTGTDLLVRPRRPGDRFQPLGMNTPKKLQDFMVDARIPRAWRQHIPIVCSPQQVIWVAGWRIDERAKVTEASQEVLRLEFVRSA